MSKLDDALAGLAPSVRANLRRKMKAGTQPLPRNRTPTASAMLAAARKVIAEKRPDRLGDEQLVLDVATAAGVKLLKGRVRDALTDRARGILVDRAAALLKTALKDRAAILVTKLADELP
jgi:hypothetical protein